MTDEPRPPEAPQAPGPPDAKPPPGLLRRYGPLLKHWALFLGIFGALIAVYETNHNWVNLHFAQFTAKLMASVMTLLGENGQATGIKVSCSLCKFKIIGECTAYYPISIFVAAVLAFPTPWIRRIIGVLLGIPVMLLINQVRLVSLCYIYKPFNDIFETIHIVVWQSLIIFLTVVLWILWATTIGRRP